MEPQLHWTSVLGIWDGRSDNESIISLVHNRPIPTVGELLAVVKSVRSKEPPELLLVTGVDGSDITVQRRFRGTPASAIGTGQDIYIVGNPNA